MTAFTRTWNAAYEAQPAEDENINLGAGRIRDLKADARERLVVDHSFAGDANDGKHNKITLRFQTAAPTLDTNDAALFTQLVGGVAELFFKDNAGNVIQVSSGGAVNCFFAPGDFNVTEDLAVTGAAAIGGAISVTGDYLYANAPADTKMRYNAGSAKIEFLVSGVVVGSFPP